MIRRVLDIALRPVRQAAAPGDDERTDRELLACFATRGDEAAFTVLVRRHGPMVRGVCRQLLRQEQDAEDAFQATFLVLARKAARVRWQESVAGWLYEVARRVALDARAQRDGALELPTEGCLAPATVVGAEQRELSAALEEELCRLGERYRTALVLCYWQGRTRDQAARQLGWSLRTLDRRLAKGREILRGRLAARGITLAVALLVSEMAAHAAPTLRVGLVEATTRAALEFATGGPVESTALYATTLAAGASRSTFPIRLQLIVGVLLVVGATAAGAAALAHFTGTEPPAIQERDGPPPEASAMAAELPEPDGLDRYGDPLPAGALLRLGTTRLRHTDFITAVVYSADGKTVASVGDSGSAPPGAERHVIHIWETATGKELRRLPGQGKRITHLTASLDGQYLAAVDRDTLYLWEFASGKRLHAIPLPRADKNEEGATSIAFTPHGKQVAAVSWKGVVRVWGVADGKESLSFAAYSYSPSRLTWGCTLAYSPDGATLAALTPADPNGSAELRLFDAATGKLRRQWTAHKDVAYAFAFSRDGKMVASGARDGTVYLWDAATGKEVRKLKPPFASVSQVAFSPDGQVLAASGLGPGPAVLWDVAMGKEVGLLRGHKHWSTGNAVPCFAFAPDGKTLVTGGMDNRLRFWNTATGAEVSPDGGGDGAFASGVAYTPDGAALVTNDFYGSLCVWDAGTGAVLRRCRVDGDVLIVGFAIAPDGRRVTAGLVQNNDKFVPRVRFWDLNTGRLRDEVLTIQSPISSVAYAAGGRTLLVSGYKKTALWDLGTAKEIAGLAPPAARAPGVPTYLACASSPDGKTLICVGKETFDLYDASSGKELRRHPRGPGAIDSFVVAPDGTTLAFSDKENRVQLVDLTTGKTVRRLVGHQASVSSLAFAPDGKSLVTGSSDSTVRLWETASGQEIRCFRGSMAHAHSVAYAPDGRTLASCCGDTTTLVWDRTGRLRGGKLAPTKLSAREGDALWEALAGADAVAAQRAMWALVAGGNASVLDLKRRLADAHGTDDRRIAPLFADLASDKFDVRQKATDKLEQLGDLALPALQRALHRQQPLEVRQRMERLVERLLGVAPSPGRLRVLRATEVLEQVGSAEARQALEMLAAPGTETWLVHEARAARDRLARRLASRP